MALQQALSHLIKSRHSEAVSASTWRPLRQPLFRALWVASLTSNIGAWMHEAGAGWLMTSLTSSPVMIALMQTATTLPIFFLALPAGALADGVDRRRMLILTQALMFIAAATLGAVALADAITPWLLLILTFALGAGAAMNAPAWQATTPELVPRADLPSAVALIGMGLNLARAVGPALGGVVVALAGAWAVFLLNAVSFLSVIVVLYSWRRTKPDRVPPEPVLNSIRAGIRYARHAPALRAVLVRTVLFVPFASALWALLPVLARHEMGLDSVGYGILFGCLGAGAVAGAIVFPEMQRRFSRDLLAVGATILFAVATVALAEIRDFGWLCVVMVAAGAAWITLMASFNIAIQSAAPSWVRARALALYLLMFQGSMAAGSAVWGAVTEHGGISMALLCAAGGLIVGLTVIRRYPLNDVEEELDLTPSAHWPEPVMVVKPQPEDGPVLVTVQYRIDPLQARDFTFAMQPVREQRLRDGALRSGLYSDPADPSRYFETFVIESWAEHLRQHKRVTVSDRIAEDRARAFHIGEEPPVMSHFISAHT